MEITQKSNRGIEENILAIWEASAHRDVQEVDDDKLAFLEAVRGYALILERGTRPSGKIYAAVFRILATAKCIHLMVASYQLLNELYKCFPRFSSTNSNYSGKNYDLGFRKGTWSPFILGQDVACVNEEERRNSVVFDPSDFAVLVQKLAQVAEKSTSASADMKCFRNMLLFQYLINILEEDFSARLGAYEDTLNWVLLRESFLNMLLGSRKINYKGLIRDCLTILCYIHELSSCMPAHLCDTSFSMALVEAQTLTCMSLQKFLVMVMDLDQSRKKADTVGDTTRADGLRLPGVEIIIDELSYKASIFFPFFKAFIHPKWKIELILHYFWKYIPMPSIRTRSSNDSAEDASLNGMLKCFSGINNTRVIIRKIGSEETQLLLAHGFQAYMLLLPPNTDKKCDAMECSADGSLGDICNKVICAFRYIKKADEDVEILPLGKQALFMASAISRTKP